MESLSIILDVDQRGFRAMTGKTDADVINVRTFEVGTLRAGTDGGKDSVAIAIRLPDGHVVIAETTAVLFDGAARAIRGWQQRRRVRGEA